LFVFGFPRSGTTLIRSILNSHSEISLVNEPEIISSLRRSGFSTGDHLNVADRARFLSDYRETHFGKHHLTTLPAERIESFLHDPGRFSFAECFEHLLPKPSHGVVWGDKSLSLVFYLKDVQAIYPQFFAISMLRDPRASILSLYRKRKLKSATGQPTFSFKTFEFFVYQSLLWCESMKEAQTAKDQLPEHVYELRFEDFLLQASFFSEQLCRNIGVVFEPAMLEKAKRKDDPVIVPELAYAHRLLTEDLDLRRASAGKELCPWATFVIQSICANFMSRYGYDLFPDGLRTWQRNFLTGLLGFVYPKIRRDVSVHVARDRVLKRKQRVRCASEVFSEE